LAEIPLLAFRKGSVRELAASYQHSTRKGPVRHLTSRKCKNAT
jgi:hypothetical protein